MQANRQSALKPVLVIFVVLGVFLSACQSEAAQWHGSPYKQRKTAPDFVLTDTLGRSYKLSDHFGQPILLFFGYTHCPDVCPSTVYNIAWVFDRVELVPYLGADFIMVTVDPDRDTPEVMGRWLSAFNPNFVGLTGDQETLEAVWESYDVSVSIDEGSQDESGGEYLVTHTSRVFAIDKYGQLVTSYNFGTPPEDILSDLLWLIHERP